MGNAPSSDLLWMSDDEHALYDHGEVRALVAACRST